MPAIELLRSRARRVWRIPAAAPRASRERRGAQILAVPFAALLCALLDLVSPPARGLQTNPSPVVASPATKTAAAKTKKQAPFSAPLCESKNITVELPREFLQLAVLNNSFIARDNSLAVITFQNYFPQPIEEIAIVAENEDDAGKLLFANVYAASAKSTVSPSWFSAYLPSFYDIAPWSKPIAPRATFTLAATSGITTALCPAQIKATVVHLEFAGGQQINYSTPGWQLPAQPQAIPGALDFYAAPRDLPQQFIVQVHQPAPLGPIIPPPVVTLLSGKQGLLFDRIRDQIQEWRFAFAIRNGESADGDETLLIRLHSPKETLSPQSFWVSPDDITSPMGVVDLFPLKIPDKWAVYYGGVDLAGVSPAQIQ